MLCDDDNDSNDNNSDINDKDNYDNQIIIMIRCDNNKMW